MGKTKRPIREIIVEKLYWLRKECRNKNNRLLEDSLGALNVSTDSLNNAFTKAMKALKEAESYLLIFDIPPEQPDPEPSDE